VAARALRVERSTFSPPELLQLPPCMAHRALQQKVGLWGTDNGQRGTHNGRTEGAASSSIAAQPRGAIIRAVREFFYGLILGAAAMYCFEYFDAPGVLAYLNSATESAVQSTHGYTH
jgi:hypothetical protein